jgi:transcriptional regulator with XRE-family HTH domain
MQEDLSPMSETQKNTGYNAVVGRKLTKPRHERGAHLMALRMNAGLSQDELAERIGVSQQTIAFWERSGKTPRSEVLSQLAEALGVSIEVLLVESNDAAATKKKGGPDGKLRKVFEEASSLPRRQQEKIMEFVSAFINQYKQNGGRV